MNQVGFDPNQTNFLLSSLLPYQSSQKRELKAALSEYQLLVMAADQTMEALRGRDFEQFDSIVTDHQCQTRAIKVAIVAETLIQTMGQTQKQLLVVQDKIKQLTEQIIPFQKGSLKDLLEREQLEVVLNPNEIFLIQAFLLTQVKLSKPSNPATPFLGNDVTDSKKLQDLAHVSTSFANNLVKELRSQLSAASVTFVFECVKKLPKNEQLAISVSPSLIWRK